MVPFPITIIWVADGAPTTRPDLGDFSPAAEGVKWVELGAAELQGNVLAARERGGVVAIAAPASLGHLLTLGVDEAVAWGASTESLRTAVDHARARAAWRAKLANESAGVELSGLALLGAAIGHEVRNPLAAAMLNCSLLDKLVPPLTEPLAASKETEIEAEDIRGALGDLGIALRMIARVVNQMVALTEGSDVDVCDLSRVLVDVTTSVHKDIERVADFVVEIPDRPCLVGLPRHRAVEILAAVLSNAAFAVEQKGGDAGNISVRVDRDGRMIVIVVVDDGIGMTPDVRRQILNPFFTRRPGAFGMGLTLAALNVRRAGGEIHIDSDAGSGTCVRLFLPVCEDAPELDRAVN